MILGKCCVFFHYDDGFIILFFHITGWFESMRQSSALDILKTGQNVFLTGSAGSGKTYTLNQYIDYLRARRVPTGKQGGRAAKKNNGGVGLTRFRFSHFLFKASGRLIMLGRADLVFKVFFPGSENNFEAGFSGLEVGDFLCASPEQKNYQL